jgi:hypothetical protein
MSQLAPIILFAYNRPQHTLKTLVALSKNLLADQSILYIYCDGPKKSSNEENLKKIEQVRDIAKSRKWCKEVFIVEREENFGLAKNIIDGVSKIVNKHGKIIVLEDDLVTSPLFLKFMNSALIKYENEDVIKSVGGYLPNVNTKTKQTIFLSGGTSWGWGTWRRVWSRVNWDSEILYEEIKLRKKEIDFNFGMYPYTKMLKDQIDGKINSWAINFYADCFLKNGLHALPPQSLIINIGLDNSGEHCEEGKSYELVKEVYLSEIYFPEKISKNSSFEKKLAKEYLRSLYDSSIISKFKMNARYLLNYYLRWNLNR